MSEYFRLYIKREHFEVHPSSLQFKTPLKNTIQEACLRRTWKETESDNDFDLLFSERNFFSIENQLVNGYHPLSPHQRINHFPNSYELCRKDLMYKNLRKYKKLLAKEGKADKADRFNFYPQTFYMPNEYTLFMDEYRRNLASFWIMKPVSSAQGRGIFFVSNPQQIAAWKNSLKGCQENILNELFIAQRYVMNPLLVGGKKFDLRVYALVTSFNPLTIYVYRCGFARFTHARYSNDLNDMDNQFIHLTNVAIQKNCGNYDKTTGGKWNLRNLRIYLYSRFSKGKIDRMFDSVEEVIVNSIESVSKIIVNDKHCFELYGFDILIDDLLNPILIEINSNPSLTANTKQDNDMKVGMLDDMLTILDLEKVLQGDETQIGGFDLVYKGKPLVKDSSLLKRSNLGCFNDRETQLKKLAKKSAMKLMQINALKKSSVLPSSTVNAGISKSQRIVNSARKKKNS